MKTLVTFILLTLACVLQHNSASVAGPQSLFTQCCSNITNMHVPQRKVKMMEMTSSGCARAAFIVTTVCDFRLCVDVNRSWAKRLWPSFKTTDANKRAPSAKCDRS